jgi:PAS domain-containing protein
MINCDGKEVRSLGAMPFLIEGGTMGARIQAHDWSISPLGPPESWPQDLRTILRIILHSKFPTYLAWGPERITFYNDAALELRGVRPEALGQPLPQSWGEVWDIVSPLLDKVFRGEAIYLQDGPIDIVQRKSFPERTWWTASFSPIPDETGAVNGALIILQETTERVLTEQRLRFLVDLSTRIRGIAEARGHGHCRGDAGTPPEGEPRRVL